jgi:hypothetical protein
MNMRKFLIFIFMRNLIRNLVVFSFFLIMGASCNQTEQPPTSPTPDEQPRLDTFVPASPSVVTSCVSSGEVLDGNAIHTQRAGLLVCVAADSTQSAETGVPEHRVLEVYNTKDNCQLVDRIMLPEGPYPEYPYYLAEINYNSARQLVGVKGFDQIFCYDLAARKLMDPLTPAYLSERPLTDAQSGQILHLEVWEEYLIGYAEDMGVFVFDLKQEEGPEPLLPVAEYQSAEAGIQALFLLPSVGNSFQAILPVYDINDQALIVYPLFRNPVLMNAGAASVQAGGQMVILNAVRPSESETGEKVIVDLDTRSLLKLPDNLQQATNKKITAWWQENR